MEVFVLGREAAQEPLTVLHFPSRARDPLKSKGFSVLVARCVAKGGVVYNDTVFASTSEAREVYKRLRDTSSEKLSERDEAMAAVASWGASRPDARQKKASEFTPTIAVKGEPCVRCDGTGTFQRGNRRLGTCYRCDGNGRDPGAGCQTHETPWQRGV